MTDEPRPTDSERWLDRMSHRGRVVRVLLALLLTVVGMVPLPYIGWGFYGPMFCGPAAALLFYAGLDRGARRVVLAVSIPTAVGLALSLFSLASYVWMGRSSADLILQVLAISLLTTSAAAVLGRPRSPKASIGRRWR